MNDPKAQSPKPKASPDSLLSGEQRWQCDLCLHTVHPGSGYMRASIVTDEGMSVRSAPGCRPDPERSCLIESEHPLLICSECYDNFWRWVRALTGTSLDSGGVLRSTGEVAEHPHRPGGTG